MPVAQLDRASVSGTEGWGFESPRAHYNCELMVHIQLAWNKEEGEKLDFSFGTGSLKVEIGKPSAMQMLLMSLAYCTAIDVITILEKMKVPLRSLRIEVQGERAEEHPRRYTHIKLIYNVFLERSDGFERKVEKAVSLSKNKYCSVSASLNANIEYEVRIHS